jgi:hypothetical protein
MKEITYWIIRFTSIDGKRLELTDGYGVRKFSNQRAALRWTKSMPDWQAAEIVQMWDMQ